VKVQKSPMIQKIPTTSIWRDHSPAFRAFLRRVGVRHDYIPTQGEVSPLYRLVQAEQAQRQLRLFEW
jgi:hypothetical protein